MYTKGVTNEHIPKNRNDMLNRSDGGLSVGTAGESVVFSVRSRACGSFRRTGNVSDSASSHKVKVIVVDAGEAQEEQWYKDQQYDFMLR